MLDLVKQSEFLDPRLTRGYGGRFYGVYTAMVADIKDPAGQGRVKVRLPWTPDNKEGVYEVWARLATMMAGGDRGSWFIPDVDDEVLVCFEAGDTRRPYVIGSLWNGQDNPPEEMDGAGENNLKTIRSRNGIVITMDDSDGQEKLTLETPAGQHVVIDDSARSVEIKDGSSESVKLEPSGITINTSANVTVNGSMVQISAAMVSVDTPMAVFSGVVQAQTVISSSIIGASYTPGAGNIW
ncbi:MAG: phage baseplate assembly protein V [Gammaproteobacteria bacterium]|nr:phage baseplate assembly protein V [Gammaproteobacteria bacterium]